MDLDKFYKSLVAFHPRIPWTEAKEAVRVAARMWRLASRADRWYLTGRFRAFDVRELHNANVGLSLSNPVFDSLYDYLSDLSQAKISLTQARTR